MWPVPHGTLLPVLSTAHVPTPVPTPGHKPLDTYSARWHWESLALQSSSTRWRVSLWPRSWGSPWAWATHPRPWDVAPPGAELQRAMFPEKQSRDKSAMSPATSLCQSHW